MLKIPKSIIQILNKQVLMFYINYITKVINDMNISTSLICCDLANLSSQLDTIVSNEGFNWLHADFMDGHFVPRYGISPELIMSLKKRYGDKVIIDSHLMVEDPYTYASVIAPYSDWFFFHYEAVTDPVRTLQMLRKNYPKLKIGLVFNLATPPLLIENIIINILQFIDGVMFMGISPGVLGTISMPDNVTKKLRLINDFNGCNGCDIKTFVDGSVNFDTVKTYKDAGAYTLVSGSSMIFKESVENQIMFGPSKIIYNINKIKSIIK